MVNGRPKPTIGELVADMAQDVSTLVRNEIELAKAELAESAKRGAAGGILIAAAVGLLMLVALLLTFVLVYALFDVTGLPLWSCFLIIAVVYLIITAILFLLARAQLQKMTGPEQAIEAQNTTKAIVSRFRPGQTEPKASDVLRPPTTPAPPTPSAPAPKPATPAAATSPSTPSHTASSSGSDPDATQAGTSSADH
jgi:hypothetical protein